MTMIEYDSKTNEVVKHNDLIKAQGELSPNAQKMLASLISMINKDDSEFQEYAMHIKDFEREINRNSNDTTATKKNALELMQNPFQLKKGVYFNWCSKVDITSINGYIIFKIDNELKPHLLKLENNFTKYRLVNILKLKGKYSPRFYEIIQERFRIFKNEYFKKTKKYPKKYTFAMEIDWLRKTYAIPSGYNYADIKRQILIKSQEDFLKYTDIKFEFEEHKIGRKVDKIIITVRDNDKGSNNFLNSQKSFIEYMRKNFVNFDIFENNEMLLSISAKGYIYDKITGKDYDNAKANEVWKIWYELAKENKLPVLIDGSCIKQGTKTKDLKSYVGKQIYLNGSDWIIEKVVKKGSQYSIICHEFYNEDFKDRFDISEVQLNAVK